MKRMRGNSFSPLQTDGDNFAMAGNKVHTVGKNVSWEDEEN